MSNSPNHPSLSNECDKTIHPDVLLVYERLRAKAREQYDPAHPDRWITLRDFVRVDGVKLCCVYDVLTWANETEPHEQFEYYDYRYHHKRPFTPVALSS